MTNIEKLKKRKKLYVILLIVCGILLAADVVFFVSGSKGPGNRPEFGSDGFPGNMAPGGAPGESGGDGSQDVSGGDGAQGASGDDGAQGASGGGSTHGTSDEDGTQEASGDDSTHGTSDEDSTQEASGDDSTQGASDGDSAQGASGKDGTQKKPDGNSMPENFDKDNMPENFDKDNLPENFDKDNMPQGGGLGNMPPGGSSIIRIICTVAGIILLILEVIFAVLLIKTNKAIKRINAGETDYPDGYDSKKKSENGGLTDPVEIRKRKQKRERIILAAVLVAAILIVIILIVCGGRSSSKQSVKVDETVQETAAESGSISKSVKGSGVIDATDETDVAVPGDIKVTKYYVKDGDAVSAGDILASVDRNTVKAAMGDAEALIEELDRKMMEVKNDSISSSLTAPSDGRVVAIYANKSDDVIDVMYEDGALVVLSLDGCLAVDVEGSDDLTVDTRVKVVNSKGRAYTGTVDAVEKDKATISVSMDDFKYGEKVTVKRKDTGKKIAKGTLYVSNELKVTGYSGTVSGVKVSEDDKVSEGDTLITLKNTDYTAEYQSLLDKRTKLVNYYNELVEIANTGYVYASADGTISDVDDTLKLSDNTSDSGSRVKADTLSHVTGFGCTGVSLLSDVVTYTDMNAYASGSVQCADTDVGNQQSVAESQAVSETVSRTVSIVWLDSNNAVTDTELPGEVTVDLLAGESVAQTVTLSNETGWSYTWTNLPKYDGQTEIAYSIRENLSDGYTVTSKVDGSVTLVINTKVREQITDNRSGTQMPDNNSDTAGTGKGSEGNNNGGTQTPAGIQMPDNNSDTAGTGKGSEGSNNGSIQAPEGIQMPDNNSDTAGTGKGSEGGNSDSTQVQADNTEEQASDSDNYNMAETVLCSLIPNDRVSISVSIDELEINKISVGQKCEVVLDSLSGQSFEGTVEKCNPVDEND